VDTVTGAARHDGPVTADAEGQDLAAIRDRLDVVDRRLVDVLAERARLIAEVIAFKRAHGMRVVDRDREEQMLEHIGSIAGESGLDPRIARQVLRAVIDAFTLLEVEQLGPDH
jgi:chorismate mutase